MKYALAAAAAALAMTAFDAQAQVYISGNAGMSILNDADATDKFNGGSGNGEISHDNGLAITGAIGTSWGAVRVEGELGYRYNDLDNLTVTRLSLAGVGTFSGQANFALDGNISSLTGMANVWYDVPTGNNWKPYLGGGLGFSRVSMEIDRVGTATATLDDDDIVFAYQLGAGIGYQLTPTTTVGLSYRFLGTTDPEFKVGSETIETEYQSHNLMVGFMYKF